jgi:hypothetical protein
MKYKYFFIFIGMFLVYSKVFSSNIDVYGARKDIAQYIIKHYGDSVRQVEQARLLKTIHHQATVLEQKRLNQIVGDIKKQYHYSQIAVDSVYYPDKQESFTTINICDPHFTHGLLKGSKGAMYQIPAKPDLIDQMIVFINKAVDYMVSHPEDANRLICRDLQCITPENKYFAEDLTYFRQQVPKQLQFIKHTIFNDSILQRRRAAIFLLAYHKDIDLVASLLERCLDDDNSYIRHDALRVFGEMYPKHPNFKVPIEKVIRSTYSCDEAERNKALIFLNELASHPKYHMALLNEVGHLKTLGQLIQPNNHLYAERILKKITKP